MTGHAYPTWLLNNKCNIYHYLEKEIMVGNAACKLLPNLAYILLYHVVNWWNIFFSILSWSTLNYITWLLNNFRVAHAKLNLFLYSYYLRNSICMDHHHYADLIMLDFCEVFDAVAHNRLLNKLKSEQHVAWVFCINQMDI